MSTMTQVLSEETVRVMNQTLADFALGDGRAILSYISTTVDTETATAAPIMKTAICNLTRFKDFYHPVHGHLAMVVCVLGTLFNLANILVLTHRDMRNPVNMILTGIAVADCLVMFEYIPFTIHMNRLDDNEITFEAKYSLAWGIFMLFHTSFTVMIHTVSTFLTLTLAIWRFIMIKYPSKAIDLCTLSRCKTLLVLGFVVPLFLTIPNVFSSLGTIFWFNSKLEKPFAEKFVTLYNFKTSWLTPDVMLTINLWLYSAVMKLIPCLVLGLFTALLVRAMYQAEALSTLLGARSQEGRRNSSRRARSTDRTTRLLIALLLLFLVAETPMGILGMLSAHHGKQFYAQCYAPLGEMMDLLALGNSAANFPLYCLMSTQFRATLAKMLRVEGKATPHALTMGLPTTQV